MAGFKRSQPGLAFSGEQVTPDEIDQYYVYQVVNPGTAAQWFGTTALGSNASAKAYVVINAIADYPRNVALTFGVTGSAGSVAGTSVVNGKDQFGQVISETLSFANGTNLGTAVGTKVFAQVTSGTHTFGTLAIAGTPILGFSTGTNTLFGLPVKIAGTGDVALLSHNAGTGAVTVNGGTVGGFVNVAMSAIRPAAAVTGTEAITVWVSSSYNPASIAKVSALKQI